MKTSYILLAIIVFVTLTGMVATDVMLKQQFEKIDWKNPYQEFVQRALPTAKHWVVEGTPTEEIIVVKTVAKPLALIDPDLVKFYRIRQQGDTVFVAFTPDDRGYQNEPREDATRELGVRLVLQLPSPQTMQIKNARLTLREFVTDKLVVSLRKSRLRTSKLAVSESFTLIANQNSFAALGNDQVKSLQATVGDSSGIWLNNTQIDSFKLQASPKAQLDLQGEALKWLK
ncbi:hypothetical protein GO755_11085 [Spirosoma sp. HMF4905]|uniref:Uncharacterized protein n=1 Tax=Spirosoma arboris TaxID=2682092 RepID=A0A7K1SA88_9BACT|nr:hypothetical protein [Spirosoma arboris]MVM30578.1 hypothetical protein [Spirosoma arboris]